MVAWLVLPLITIFWILPAVWGIASYLRRRRKQFPGAMSAAECALAEERGGALLRDLLDDQEYQQLMWLGYLDVASPHHEKRVYRIPRDAGWVRVYTEGRALMELCIQPVAPLPANDVVALHKLMIEGNEQGYLACANEVPLILPSQFYSQ